MSFTEKVRRSAVMAAALWLCACPALAADTPQYFTWHPDTKLLDADLDNVELLAAMKSLHEATGIEIHAPAGVSKTISTKFSGVPLGEALDRMLSGLNYHGSLAGGVYQLHIIDPKAEGTGNSVAMRNAPARPAPVRPVPMITPQSGGGNRGDFGNRGDRGNDAEREQKEAQKKAIQEMLKSQGIDPKKMKREDLENLVKQKKNRK